MVSVIMLTYNHEKFIEQAIEGVLMQQTSFPVHLYIADDASTDKTSAICKAYTEKYPGRITHLLNKTNLGVRDNYNKAFKACKDKYIAHCEGDDYWADAYKLQKQVDFLEQNEQYAICWTKYNVIDEKSAASNSAAQPDWLSMIGNEERFEVNLDNIFKPFVTLTLTVIFRQVAINKSVYVSLKYSKDNTVFCMCLSYGKGAVLNFFGATYRVHNNGVFSKSTLLERRYENFLNLNEIVNNIPNCNNAHLKNIRNSNLLEVFDISLLNQEFASLSKLSALLCRILWYCKPADKLHSTKMFLKQLALIAGKKKLLKTGSQKLTQ